MQLVFPIKSSIKSSYKKSYKRSHILFTLLNTIGTSKEYNFTLKSYYYIITSFWEHQIHQIYFWEIKLFSSSHLCSYRWFINVFIGAILIPFISQFIILIINIRTLFKQTQIIVLEPRKCPLDLVYPADVTGAKYSTAALTSIILREIRSSNLQTV